MHSKDENKGKNENRTRQTITNSIINNICIPIKNTAYRKRSSREKENAKHYRIRVQRTLSSFIALNNFIIENNTEFLDKIYRVNNMPSKQVNEVLAMEELVHEIKENLRLKANPTRTNRSSRPSPYHIPCRSWSGEASTTCEHNKKAVSSKKAEDSIDDPYELLQALLKSNNLVKEAVRRLQLNNISPKQRYFYESDEESRSPMIRMCQLEL